MNKREVMEAAARALWLAMAAMVDEKPGSLTNAEGDAFMLIDSFPTIKENKKGLFLILVEREQKEKE